MHSASSLSDAQIVSVLFMLCKALARSFGGFGIACWGEGPVGWCFLLV